MDQSDDVSVEVVAPGGWRARFNGIDTRIVLLSILIVVCLGVGVYAYQEDKRANEEARKDFLSQHKTTQSLLASVIANQRAIIDTIHESQRATGENIGEMTYVLTLTNGKREALKMEMPQSLRRKLYER